MNTKKVALIILDGWGIGKDPKVSAIAQANTPTFNRLMENYPNNTLVTFGEDVGLPEGQMGNSEVGHINIGAGRIVYQELARINKAFRDKEILDNKVLLDAIQVAKNKNKKIHLMGLVSDGGVHSHVDHLLGLCNILSTHSDINVYIHAFLDGRDTDPRSGLGFLHNVQLKIQNTNATLASAIGRYYAMDRDKRWERVKLAYDMLVNGVGTEADDILSSLQKSYELGVTDEFIQPIIHHSFNEKNMNIEPDDVVIFFNFRTDRPRQLTEVLTQQDHPEFEMHKLPLHFVTFAEYDQRFIGLHVIFHKDNVSNTLGQVISESGLSQVRIAETEKYPHVTFFFNGGVEQVFEGETRIMVPSPKVATYDLQPEMSAPEITEKLITHINLFKPDFICLNFANTDMVGHTGDFNAAIKAAETVDYCLGLLLDTLLSHSYINMIIADHGNSDMMINEDGSPNTAHTTNLVPIILCGNEFKKTNIKLNPGKLGDVAPTILKLMNLDIPKDMTGHVIAFSENQ